MKTIKDNSIYYNNYTSNNCKFSRLDPKHSGNNVFANQVYMDMELLYTSQIPLFNNCHIRYNSKRILNSRLIREKTAPMEYLDMNRIIAP